MTQASYKQQLFAYVGGKSGHCPPRGLLKIFMKLSTQVKMNNGRIPGSDTGTVSFPFCALSQLSELCSKRLQKVKVYLMKNSQKCPREVPFDPGGTRSCSCQGPVSPGLFRAVFCDLPSWWGSISPLSALPSEVSGAILGLGRGEMG